MFGQAPDNPAVNKGGFSRWFNHRIASMLKKENFVRGMVATEHAGHCSQRANRNRVASAHCRYEYRAAKYYIIS